MTRKGRFGEFVCEWEGESVKLVPTWLLTVTIGFGGGDER